MRYPARKTLGTTRGPRDTGLLLLLLGLVLVKLVLYGVVVPPWQAPDEPMHFQYSYLLAQNHRIPQGDDLWDMPMRRALHLSMERWNFWGYRSLPSPEALPSSYSAASVHPPLYYILTIPPVAVLAPLGMEAQAYGARLVSAFLGLLSILVAYLVARELFPRDPWLRVGIPAFLAFLPMHSFIASSINNDNLAELIVGLILLALVRAYKRGWTIPTFITILALLGAAWFTKRTALFIFPLALGAVAVHLWRLVVRKHSLRVALAAALATGLVLGFLLALSARSLPEPRLSLDGWTAGSPYFSSVSKSQEARGGASGLRLDYQRPDATADLTTMFRQVIPEVDKDTYTVSFYSRVLTGTMGVAVSAVTPTGAHAGWISYDAVGNMTNRSWERKTFAFTVPNSGPLALALMAESEGAALYDDVRLVRGQDPEGGENLLANGGFEGWTAYPIAPQDPLWGLLRITPDFIASTLSQPRYDLSSLPADFGLTFQSFWGNFGWLALPLGEPWYWGLALVSLAALGGLLLLAIGRGRRTALEPWQSQGLAILALALALALAQTLGAWLLTGTPQQGRYLFLAAISWATLLVLGLRELAPERHRSRFLFILVSGAFLFDSVALFAYIVPFYLAW